MVVESVAPKKLPGKILPDITCSGQGNATIPNCILEIPLITRNARFLTLIVRIGQRGTVSSSS